MQNIVKLPLNNLIACMDQEHQRVASAIYDKYGEQMSIVPGASRNHQTWPGGYLSHIEEAMNIANMLYDGLTAMRPVDFTRSQALFCVYMHDFDKIQRYIVQADGSVVKGVYDKDYIAKTEEILKNDFGYQLSDVEFNALKYAHGEGDDYKKTERIMLPLATIVHSADVISARIWPENGRNSDSWND